MSEASLAGSTVLVVEDDFYLAEDARDALERAGATVFGPFGEAAEALALLRDTTPDCAVTDINLNGTPSFDLARVIINRDIPMLFATGYDATAIPADLSGVARLQKPISMRALVAAVAELGRAASAKA